MDNRDNRNNDNTPEYIKFRGRKDVEFCSGIVGMRKNSSSWLLQKLVENSAERIWESYRILKRGAVWQVNQLSFDVSRSLSNKRHFKRSEHWHIVEDPIEMRLKWPHGEEPIRDRNARKSLDLSELTWHNAKNIGSQKGNIIEV